MCWQRRRLLLTLLLGQVVLGLAATLASATPASATPASATRIAAEPTPGGAPVRSPPSAPAAPAAPAARPTAVPTPDATVDGRTVLCVKTENARDLIDSATALGLGRRGESESRLRPMSDPHGAGLTIGEWRERYPQDFGRACAALIAARAMTTTSPDSGSAWDNLVAPVTGLLSVILGAGLTLFSAWLTTNKATSQRIAGDLSTAVAAYHRACSACLEAWKDGQGGEKEAEMDGPVDALTKALDQARSRWPRWQRPADLRELIKDLDAEIREPTNWPDEAAQRKEKAADNLARLDEIRTCTWRIVTAIEHPWRDRKEKRAP